MSTRNNACTNDLQDACSVAILGEGDWAPGVIEQFVGRTARDGQNSLISGFVPVAPVESNPAMAEVLSIKKHQAMGILDPGRDIDLDVVATDQSRVRRLANDFIILREKPLSVEVEHELNLAAT